MAVLLLGIQQRALAKIVHLPAREKAPVPYVSLIHLDYRFVCRVAVMANGGQGTSVTYARVA